MKLTRRIKFLYRYITTPRRWRKIANAQVLLVLIAAAIFLSALIWTNPIPSTAATATASPALTASAVAGPTRTPFPPEYATNSQETIGITFAGAVLVLIVVIGVIVFMPRGEA